MNKSKMATTKTPICLCGSISFQKMEPVLHLKRRSSSTSLNLCVICQKDDKDVRQAGKQGLLTLKDAVTARSKLRDVSNRDIIHRLEVVLHSADAESVVWHRNCYAQFTDKGKIQRLQKSQKTLRRNSAVDISGEQTSSSSETCIASVSKHVLRGSVPGTDWNKCLFCQTVHTKHRLVSVTTQKMSAQIIEAAQFDKILRIRVACVNDLIAAEGKYHLQCYVNFTRSTQTIQSISHNTDLAMAWLCSELQASAQKGHVLELHDVFNRYCSLTDDAGIEIPSSFLSRRASFTEKLKHNLMEIYEFIPMPHRTSSGNKTLLVPTKYRHIPISQMEDQDNDELTMPVQTGDDNLLSLVHIALKIRRDLVSQPGHKGFNVSEDDAAACVPDSLYIFLRLLFEGQSFIDGETDENNGEDVEKKVQTKVLSIAQDIVFGVSHGKKWTPKHIGLGSTLHQATRSKHLVQLFHNAGHVLSYESILRMDNALAEHTIQNMDTDNGVVIPPNLTPGKFVHFSADNIDINDSSLDGKNTFHATQMAAWQRGPAPDLNLHDLVPSKHKSLAVPDAMNTIIEANVRETLRAPVFNAEIHPEWYTEVESENPSAQLARATDMAFFMRRQNQNPRLGWTQHNQFHSTMAPQQLTTIGYLPIIQAPAHELDTLTTVIKRCIYISSKLGQKYAVLTVDQALYCKLLELKSAIPEFKEVLIPRLGGLHISLNFLKAIGQHMQSSGLADVWSESGIMGPTATEHCMAGKSYARGMRAHKLTLQALWQLLLPQLTVYLEEHDEQLKNELDNASDCINTLISVINTDRFRKAMEGFLEDRESNVNFKFWWQYMEMVMILLMFTRAQRDGIWKLHLYAFQQILPYFYRYDHTNYARWGAVYVAEMHQLPEEVSAEFEAGNFVVKRSQKKFNQVDPDHSQEWLNAVGKKGGGIVGITRNTQALSKWALSYNLRAHIASDTRIMYNISLDDQLTHKEATPSRNQRDHVDEMSLCTTLRRFGVFSADQQPILQNIVTKDICTECIQQSLMKAKQLGQESLNAFVKERLVDTEQPTKTKFHDPLLKNKALTFSNLYKVQTKAATGKVQSLKADRNIMQRLITAYEAGRKVNLYEILKHELMPVPIALAETDGTLRSGAKSLLMDAMTSGTTCPPTIKPEGTSCLIIDGHALIQAIGKPARAKTFGDLAGIFVRSVVQSGFLFDRIDVLFDRYYATTIKVSTRTKRSKSAQPIRKVVTDGSVPLPVNWDNFLALPENKADLARFLSQQLMQNSPKDKCIIVAGGFENEEEVQCSDQTKELGSLRAKHEEADTRVILHCLHAESQTIVVSARDTDVFVLLVAHFHKFDCSYLWMKAGTSKKQKYVPVHTVCSELSFTQSVSLALLPFHALTGCDTVSFLAGHSKKTAWKVFKEQHHLLVGLGNGELNDDKIKSAEKFVCRIYASEEDDIDKARVISFTGSRSMQVLPPSSDAVRLHVHRVHYQASVWRQAHCPYPNLPEPTAHGWNLVDGKLIPTLTSLQAVPESCLEVVSCSCTTRCQTLRCKCRKSKLLCTGACKCVHTLDSCMNIQD